MRWVGTDFNSYNNKYHDKYKKINTYSNTNKIIDVIFKNKKNKTMTKLTERKKKK